MAIETAPSKWSALKYILMRVYGVNPHFQPWLYMQQENMKAKQVRPKQYKEGKHLKNKCTQNRKDFRKKGRKNEVRQSKTKERKTTRLWFTLLFLLSTQGNNRLSITPLTSFQKYTNLTAKILVFDNHTWFLVAGSSRMVVDLTSSFSKSLPWLTTLQLFYDTFIFRTVKRR